MRLYFLILVLLQPFCSVAQTIPNVVIVRDFLVEGNRRTKADILTRELTFRAGDTLSVHDLATRLEENRLRLLNTNLFNSVKINVKNWTNDDKASIVISIAERWYFYPIPIFELADRNFNVWWKDQNRDLRRSNYGLRLTHRNTTGHRDPFSTTIQFGYTPKFSVGYSFPYLNKKQTIGAYAGAFYATNREVGYATDSNRVVFFKNPLSSVSTRFSYNMGLSFTPGLRTSHLLSMGYSEQTLDTAITERLNRDFFLDSKESQSYFWLSYDFSHDTRDFRPFPLRGHAMSLNISKLGFLAHDNVNILNLSFNWAQYFKIYKNWSFETEIRAKTTLLRHLQPYNLQRGIGYGSNYMRGYELFVVDSYDFGISKNSLRYMLIDTELDLSSATNKAKILSGFASFPLKVYVSGNLDLGYSYTPQYKPSNDFNNRLLYGGGIGLNILAMHGMLGQIEYSFNHTGKGGLYMRYKSNF